MTVRVMRNHGKLIACGLFALVLFYLLPAAWRAATRALIGWDISIAIYLALAFIAMSNFDLKRVRSRAADQDEGALLILLLTTMAVIASLVAIVVLLGEVRISEGQSQTGYFALAAVTVLVSWTLTHTIFALHYAHEFYGGADLGRGGGLSFPNERQPDYWDFVYFSFVIGMTFQVSDVQVTTKRVRRLVVAHGVVSFFFSVAILALTVNIGANLI
ncbi:MAG: DUF1345 domain-containing protein [Rhizobiales bacterium]|nr:DUF1345 domain-containing protein [Hyphomicrobiales bacterium]